MSNPLCIIDCDVLKYSCGFSIQKTDKDSGIMTVEPVKHAFYNINSIIRKVLKRCNSNNYQCMLTKRGDKTNFRYEIYPEYKACRTKIAKPIYYNECHEFIQRRWLAQETEGQEADDAISILHYSTNPFGFNKKACNSVICSIDKDFNNCAGWHYNWNKDEIYYVSEIEALQNFYLQILTGDVCDDIPRIKKGWRQSKTEEKIKAATTEEQLIQIIRNEIEEVHFKDSPKRSLTNSQVKQMIDDEILWRGRLVWLRRSEDQLWQVPETNSVTQL